MADDKLLGAASSGDPRNATWYLGVTEAVQSSAYKLQRRLQERQEKQAIMNTYSYDAIDALCKQVVLLASAVAYLAAAEERREGAKTRIITDLD